MPDGGGIAHKLVDPTTGDEVPSDKVVPKKKPAEREVEMAARLVDSLAADFEPKRYKNTYRDRLLKLIKRKAEGEEIKVEAPPEPEPSDDLLAALQASLDAGGNGGKKKR